MAKVLDYDFVRPWWSNPVVNGIGGGVASGGGGYAVTRDPQTSGIVGVIGSIVTGGVTYALTHNKVFDKSPSGIDGTIKGAEFVDNVLRFDGKGDRLRSGDFPEDLASKLQDEHAIALMVKPAGLKEHDRVYLTQTTYRPFTLIGGRDLNYNFVDEEGETRSFSNAFVDDPSDWIDSWWKLGFNYISEDLVGLYVAKRGETGKLVTKTNAHRIQRPFAYIGFTPIWGELFWGDCDWIKVFDDTLSEDEFDAL